MSRLSQSEAWMGNRESFWVVVAPSFSPRQKRVAREYVAVRSAVIGDLRHQIDGRKGAAVTEKVLDTTNPKRVSAERRSLPSRKVGNELAVNKDT